MLEEECQMCPVWQENGTDGYQQLGDEVLGHDGQRPMFTGRYYTEHSPRITLGMWFSASMLA